jgi:hypothetical protein
MFITPGNVGAFVAGNKNMVRHYTYKCMEELDRSNELAVAQQAEC